MHFEGSTIIFQLILVIIFREWLRCVQSEDFNLADIFLQNDNNENVNNNNINNNDENKSEFQVINSKLAVSVR